MLRISVLRDRRILSLRYVEIHSGSSRFKVGACIVDSSNRIVSVGYNGFPTGCSDDEFPWKRDSEDPLENKYAYVCHAESNAIMNKNSVHLKGCTLYVTLAPCNECAKLIIQSGIKKVVFCEDKYHDSWMWVAARKMFNASGT